MRAGRHTGNASYLGGTVGQNRPGGVGIHVPITSDAKGLEAALGSASGMIQRFIGGVTAVGVAAAAAFSVRAITQFSAESLKLAAVTEGIREAFNKIGDEDFLRSLRDAVRGTVDDMQLMRQAVRANNFQIPLEKLGTFFEFATKRAAQTGDAVQYLVESIILGIGRKSPLILDNLGIAAIRLREKLRGVGVETASVAEVTEAMAEIVEEELESMGDVSLTTEQKFQQLQAAMQNVKLAWGEVLISSGGTDVATTLSTALNAQASVIGKWNLSFKSFGDFFLTTFDKMVDAVIHFGKVWNKLPLVWVYNRFKEILGPIRDEMKEMARIAAHDMGFKDALKGDKEEVDAIAAALARFRTGQVGAIATRDDFVRAAKLFRLQLIREREEVFGLGDAWDEYTKRIEAVDKIINPPKDPAPTGLLARLRAELKEFKEQRELLDNAQEIASYNEKIKAHERYIKILTGELDLEKEKLDAIREQRKLDSESMPSRMTPQATSKYDLMGFDYVGTVDFYDKQVDIVRNANGEIMIYEEELTRKMTLELDKRTEATQRYLDNRQEIYDRLKEQDEELAQAIESTIVVAANSLVNALWDVAEGTKDMSDALQDVFKTLLSHIMNVIAANFAQAVSSGLAHGASKGGAVGMVAEGALTAAAFTALIPSLNFFADGGIVYGPTMGVMGEYAGASANPEVIAPLNKLKSMLGGVGGTQQIEMVGMVRGEDLYYIMKKQESKNSRYSG